MSCENKESLTGVAILSNGGAGQLQFIIDEKVNESEKSEEKAGDVVWYLSCVAC